jgi:hypothetical protein
LQIGARVPFPLVSGDKDCERIIRAFRSEASDRLGSSSRGD